MRRILITESMKEEAKAYSKSLFKDKTKRFQQPDEKIDDLLVNLKTLNPRYFEYLRRLKDLREELNFATPDTFIRYFLSFSFLTEEDLSTKIGYNNKKQAFYEHVVDAMRFDAVGDDERLMKHFMKLGIKSCVYCNSQYAITASDENGDEKSKSSDETEYLKNYTLDHIWPKSKYPFLCTNFFNLVPCCAHCNSTKNATEELKDFGFYTTDENAEKDVFKFQLDNASFIRYYVNHDSNLLKVIFSAINESDSKWVEVFNKNFHVEELTNSHTDVLEELLWKRLMYDDTYRDVLKTQFENIISTSDFNRFLLGNYDAPEDVHKRPLAKMIQDIARQLDMI